MVNGELRAAYDACERHARMHYENFPVASLLLPRAMRPHVAAVYAFARAADDFADEGNRSAEERLRLLDGWCARLRHAAASSGRDRPPSPGEPPHAAEIFLALGASIRAKRLPLALFEDLLSAFRQDVCVTQYPTWDDLLDYSRRSANPVGRLVLRIADHDDPVLDSWSDAICTALQLANFWQDLGIDVRRGRLYVPLDRVSAHGADRSDLAAGTVTVSWSRVLSDVVSRTRALFARGRPLCDAVGGRLRYELRATWLGGMRILDRLERSHFDALGHRPAIGVADAPWLAWKMITWGSGKTTR